MTIDEALNLAGKIAEIAVMANRKTDYTIISKPDHISFECPFCKEEVGVPFEDVNFNTDYWGDGAQVDCPKCGKEVELGGYEYE